MKIKRSPKIVQQVKEASELRARLLEKINKYLGDAAVGGAVSSLCKTIELSAEGFKLILTETPVCSVDRKSSMLSGPFFSSAERPNYWDGMFPIIQLDLREISQLAGRDFGDGLFQFWYEPGADADMQDAFEIPRSEVEGQVMTPFGSGEDEDEDEDESPPYEEEIYKKSSETVKVISGYESIGIQSQASIDDLSDNDFPDDLKRLIQVDLNRFVDITKSKDVLHVLGSFYPIQYSAADIGMPCLIHFPQWNGVGNAQVFIDPPGRFEFYESYD